MRNYNTEAKPTPDKKYDYDFDAIVRSYMMRSFLPFFKAGPALEIGCHEGRSTALFSEHFRDLVVVEPSSDAITAARECTPDWVTYINATFEDATFDRKFGSVFLINTLEHVEDAQRILTKIRQSLSSDGLFFVLVPNAEAPSRQIAVLMGLIPSNNAITPGEWQHGHRRTYSFDTLNADVRSAGFEVVQRGGLMFKALANYQMDLALDAGIIDPRYIEGIYELGMIYPALCASIFMICRPSTTQLPIIASQ